MSALTEKKKCITLVWRIENFSKLNLPKGRSIRSPPMGVGEDCGAEWQLYVYPKGIRSENFIDVELVRFAEDGDNVLCDFSFLTTDGVPRFTKLGGRRYGPWDWGIVDFMERAKIEERRSEFLPRDTLTLQCCVWGKSVRARVSEKHVAHTQILENGLEGESRCDNFGNLQLPFPTDSGSGADSNPPTVLSNIRVVSSNDADPSTLFCVD